jgi:hypothetical protein
MFAVTNLRYFTSNSWDFKNNSLLTLRQNLHPSYREAFDKDISELSYRDYLINSYVGFRRFLLKEAAYATPQTRRHYRR